ncbi:MAG TPA: site-2 protease family protein [Myxococcaceae bacterium]|nr:site-2 protease family protein [Myxococcaceae bacterium]
MLRFRLGPISVLVHPAHFLVGLVFGLWGVENLDAGPGAKATLVVTWIVVVFISVLVHELGHALAFRAFGYPSTIQLVMFGGVTTPATDAPLSWGKDVVCTLAGPLFGLSLGLLCWWTSHAFPWGETASRALRLATTANAAWAILNLLPILPMDGGRVSRALLGRIFGRGGVVAALGIGVLTCAGLALLLYRSGGGDPVLLVFLLLFGFQNFQALIGFWRTEPDGPTPPQLAEAEALLRAGKVEQARELASALLRGDPPVAIRSRIHHLLGWVALKEGEGRRALDEFSQVQGRPIEPQAIAAAFSLIGDDARAIPLWEQAARQTRDPTILHEWAGALIRQGQVAAASALPGVDLATAFERAERVAFLRGAYSEAARFGEESLARRPSADRAYEVACAYARAGDARRAMTLLLRARELGYSDREAAAGDPDLAPLSGEPVFQEWLASLGKSAAS